MRNKRQSYDHTEGSVLKSLVVLSIPIILAQILQTMYQLTDTFWVGRLGADAVAAVSLSFPVLFVVLSFGIGFSIAGTVFVSQYKGKKDKESVDHISGQTVLLIAAVSLILGLFGFFISPFIIHLMGAEPNVFSGATSYLKISFLGMVFTFVYIAFQSLMRGVGEVKIPLYIVLGTVLLNAALDPLFIFGYKNFPAYGVSGAALATIGTQGVSALIGLFVLFNGKNEIHVRKKHLKPDFKLILKLTKLGLPASLEQTIRGTGFTVMTFLVAGFGTTVIAAYGIGFRILSFIIIPALGLSMATSTLVGQNIGAGKINRIKEVLKLGNIFGFLSLTAIGFILFVFANQITGFFIPLDSAVAEQSALFVKIMSLTFGFIGIQFVLIGALRGSGNTIAAMMLSIISQFILQFPLAYILSYHTNLSESGIWVSYPITNVAMALITVLWFAKGTWKNKKITEDGKISEKITEEAISEEAL